MLQSSEFRILAALDEEIGVAETERELRKLKVAHLC